MTCSRVIDLRNFREEPKLFAVLSVLRVEK